MKKIISRFLETIWFIFAIGVVLAAFMVSLSHLTEPVLNEHRADIEKWASDLLHIPVKIGEVQVFWHGLQPEVAIQHVVLLNPEKKQSLMDIQRLRIDFSLVKSVLNWRPIAADITLSGMQLTLRETKDGFQLNGWGAVDVTSDTTGNSAEENKVIAWIFSQPKLVLQHVHVIYISIDKKIKNVTLQKLSLMNKKDNHLFDGNVSLDQVLPTYAQIHLAWVGKSLDWKTVSATSVLHLWNSDMDVETQCRLKPIPNALPWIDLSAHFSIHHVENLWHYLPLSQMDPALVFWLQHAFLRGEMESGNAIIQGNLQDFPFDQNKGKFFIEGEAKDITFHYAPEWPDVTSLSGELIFSGSTMKARATSGFIEGMPITTGQAVMTNLGLPDPCLLEIQSVVEGDMTQGLHLIQNSPLKKVVGEKMEGMLLRGPAQLTLALSIPLKKPETTKVMGNLDLENVNLSLPAWKLTYAGIHGPLHFTEKKIEAKNLQGKLLGSDATLDLITEKDKVKAELKSTIDMMSLQTWLRIPLTHIMQGSTTYQVALRFTEGNTHQVNLRSDLKGVEIQLPDPYGKRSEDVKRFQLNLIDPNQMMLYYGNVIATIRDKSQEWQIDVDSQDILGQVSFPKNTIQSVIRGNFQRFYITELMNGKNNTIYPRDLPPLLFTANDVQYKTMKFGKVILETEPNSTGMTIKRFTVDSTGSTLTANGTWTRIQNQNRSHLIGEMTTPKVSAMLKEWGFDATNLVGSQGKATFDLTWPEAPFNPVLTDMSGDIVIQLTEGRIIKLSEGSNAKMEFGRMLNVFSLSTIPRRLSLDFSDLFQSGYSFDYAKGDVHLKRGNAFTTNTRLNGPIARVEVKGRIGLNQKDYDLQLAVTPYVTSSLPVVATLAGGPIAGAITWLADKVISRAVSKVITYHYTVTGPWRDPVWKQISKVENPTIK